MNLPVRRQLEFVCHCSGLVKDFERTDSFVVQLLLWARKVKVGGIQPYLVSDLIDVCIAPSLVVLGFHPPGGFFQCGLSLFMNLRHVLGKLGSGRVSER